MLGVLCAVGLFNYAVDPLHYYRGISAINKVYFPGYQRFQNVGLARNLHYDTVVIGSSVTENFLPSYIRQSWGTASAKLSISGSTAREQAGILRVALGTGQVRNVIWGLDTSAFIGGPDRVRDDQAPYPYFMYRPSAWLNPEYPLSLSTLDLSLRVLRGWGETDLNELDAWYRRFSYGPAPVLKAWAGTCAMFARKFAPERIEAVAQAGGLVREAVLADLDPLVRNHPDVSFYLFFPPTATLGYLPVDSGMLEGTLRLRRAVAAAARGGWPNAKLFDFQTEFAVTDDLANYKDPLHFGMRISEMIIDSLRAGRQRVEPATLEDGSRSLVAHIDGYDLCRGTDRIGGPDLALIRGSSG